MYQKPYKNFFILINIQHLSKNLKRNLPVTSGNYQHGAKFFIFWFHLFSFFPLAVSLTLFRCLSLPLSVYSTSMGCESSNTGMLLNQINWKYIGLKVNGYSNSILPNPDMKPSIKGFYRLRIMKAKFLHLHPLLINEESEWVGGLRHCFKDFCEVHQRLFHASQLFFIVPLNPQHSNFRFEVNLLGGQLGRQVGRHDLKKERKVVIRL